MRDKEIPSTESGKARGAVTLYQKVPATYIYVCMYVGLQPIYNWEGDQLVSVLFTATTRLWSASFPEIVSHQLQFLNGIPVRSVRGRKNNHVDKQVISTNMELTNYHWIGLRDKHTGHTYIRW